MLNEKQSVAVAPANTKRYGVTADILLKTKRKELPTLVNPLFPQTGVVAFAGSSDTGKSTFLRQLATAISTGQEEFLGYPLNLKFRKAIYVSTEDDKFAMEYLLGVQYNGMQKQYGEELNEDEYQGLRFIFDTENVMAKLEAELSIEPVDAIIIDTFTDMYGDDLNSSNQVRNYLNTYSNLAERHQTLVIFLHHTGKRTEKLTPSKSNLLGSQGFEAKMRLVMTLRRDNNDSNLRHLCVVKGNYLKDDLKEKSIVLDFSEDMIFTNTGNTVPFEELGASENDVKKKEMKGIAKDLKEDGKTCKEIARILHQEHEYSVSSSTISNWTKD
jgi:RecA-family ATPase